MNTLKLTSPNMKGEDVKILQKLLKSDNYYNDKIDGIFGEHTALGVKSAKWDMGYAENDINSTVDAQFMKYYTGGQNKSILMRQRAKSRARKATLGDAAREIAAQFVGVSEQPAGSNKVMFSNWYGITGPWCAMFVTYCYTQAKSKTFVKGQRYAYCPYILADAKAHRNNLRVIPANEVRSGDVVLFDWNKDGVADHVGITTSTVVNKSFATIEGNTSGTNPSDGGMVANMTRQTKDVIAFVRVLA